ncbi:MAG: hypothetical protein D3916_15780, partial [Candidatus Electrothrix sp. MAN1_4]|nr:hypothetical protein [Candidatus Electrothrix sp. MAN1_4]
MTRLNLQEKIYVRMGDSLCIDKFNIFYIRLLVKYVKRGIIRSVLLSEFKKNESYKRLYRSNGFREWYKFQLFNSMWELFIKGFIDLCGCNFKIETYELLTILRKLSIYIDDALDLHRIGGICEEDISNIEMKKALESDKVKFNIKALEKFLEIHGEKYKNSIIDFLDNIFSHYEKGYTTILRKNDIPFSDCLYLTEQDSGMWLYVISECLALFNDFSLSEKDREVLFNLGV